MNVKPRKALQGDGNQTSDYFGEGGDDKHRSEGNFGSAENFLYVMLSDGRTSAFT